MTPAETYIVGDSRLEAFTEEPWEEIERDPRGLFLCWEPPEQAAHYIMGCDSSEGITGWNRGTRTDGDHKTDNGAIEIFKVNGAKELLWKKDEDGKRVPDMDPNTRRQRVRYRDVQVGEFAAPCDAVEIARVANVLGRLYHGDAEDQCELIWEGYPGCGMLTTQELLRLGYANLWQWEYFAAQVAEETKFLGWRSTRETQRILWYRARRHLMNRSAIIRSRWLKNEYSTAEIDLEKMRARASYGRHDDLFMAANLAFWAGHDWSYNPDEAPEPINEGKIATDFQTYAPVLGDDRVSMEDWREAATADWWD